MPPCLDWDTRPITPQQAEKSAPYIRPDFSYRQAGPAQESSAVLLCFLGPGGLSPAGRTGRPGDGEESEGLRTLPEAQGPL